MNDRTEAVAIFAPLWQRKWLILAVAMLVAGATYAYYKRRPTVYSAATQLYLGGGAEEQGLLNEKKTVSLDAANQAALINSSLVREAARRQLRNEHDLAAAHGAARAKAAEKSQFIGITAEARTPRAAAALANATAQAYIKRQHAGYLREIRGAIAVVHSQIRRIEAGSSRSSSTSKGKSSSSLSTAVTLQAANLNTKINQLESDLSITGVEQLDAAKPSEAQLLSPTPKKNAVFAFVLGLVLAAMAAYALSRFDRRLRGLADIEAVFDAQILAALPAVRRPIVVRDGHAAPAMPLNEPLRRLHTNLQLAGLNGRGVPPRSILFLSADAGDGRSTAVAGLALVQREAGERVAVVEADLRRPALAGLLGAGGPNGLAEVLAGKVGHGAAMQSAKPAAPGSAAETTAAHGGVSTVVEADGVGSVSVLSSGGAAANPPALLARPAMKELLNRVAEEFDYVLVDAPPPLEVSDAMPLLTAVDGIVIVARAGHTGEASAQRLVRLLSQVASARVLGVVANCVPRRDMRRYGFTSPPGRARGLIGR
jgi:succinoglycan biosynthesis transport protein ExoP